MIVKTSAERLLAIAQEYSKEWQELRDRITIHISKHNPEV